MSEIRGRFSLLEGLGQQLEEHPPKRGLDGVQAAVKVTLAEHLWHVAELMQEPVCLLDLAAEEGRGHQGDGHDLGGGQPGLGIVAAAVADGLQEVIAQTVDGGYGIVQCVLPIREGFRQPSDREDIAYQDREQLGLGLSFICLPPAMLFAGDGPILARTGPSSFLTRTAVRLLRPPGSRCLDLEDPHSRGRPSRR